MTVVEVVHWLGAIEVAIGAVMSAWAFPSWRWFFCLGIVTGFAGGFVQ